MSGSVTSSAYFSAVICPLVTSLSSWSIASPPGACVPIAAISGFSSGPAKVPDDSRPEPAEERLKRFHM